MASEEDFENTSLDALKAELAHLRKEMSPTKDDLRKLRSKAREYRFKRDDLNYLVKSLSAEIKDRREERDTLNEEVRLQKAIRQALWENIQELVSQLRNLIDAMPQSLTKKQSFLSRREKELDWRLQTTPLSLTQERDLVQEIAEIEAQLDDIRKFQVQQTEVDKIKQKIGKLRNEADGTHIIVRETADKAQTIHETMIDHLRKIDESRKAADQFHENFIKEMQTIALKSSEIDQQQERFNKIYAEVKKRDKSDFDQRRKSERRKVDDLRKKKIDEAEEKMKTGGKLTFDEYFLLHESEILPETTEEK